jgi:hypothetical protein
MLVLDVETDSVWHDALLDKLILRDCNIFLVQIINSFLKLVSVGPNRLSVIFLMVCHRVPFCLQLFVTSSVRMPPRSMGVSLLHSPMT